MSYPQQMPPQQYVQGQNVHNQEWQASFCDCSPCSTCMLGWCCPCILIGKTFARIEDPSLQSYSCCNGVCMKSALTNCFGYGWIYTCVKRGHIRHRFGLKGSGCGDCCKTYWCPCCVIIQQDNEVKLRLAAGPVVQGYMPQAPMTQAPMKM